jgi:glycosyltransferase involved in cell wall biosynthesis
MSSNKDLGILIISFNEEIHLRRCIENARKLSDQIFVVDSFSSDKSIEILEELGVTYLKNSFSTHAKQINIGIDHFPFEVKWLLRLDCDELLSDDLINEIKAKVSDTDEYPFNGYFIQRKVNFLQGILHYGMINPIWLLRLWKRVDGKCNDLWMDEKIELVNPQTARMNGLLYDHNLNELTWWIQKHNQYATREAYEILRQKYRLHTPQETATQDRRVVQAKKMYNQFPIFVRPFVLFIYAYFIKLGFLDGKRGLIWNFLQVFWYRFLVDVKVFEFEIKHQLNAEIIRETINKQFEN